MSHFTKLLSIAIMAGSLLSGCQSIGPHSMQSEQMQLEQTINKKLLTSYDWQLIEAKDAKGQPITALFTQPNLLLTLSFNSIDGQNIVSLKNTCNLISGEYTAVNGELIISRYTSTMKACPTDQANFDSAAARVAMGHYSLAAMDDGTPVLQVTQHGEMARFKAVAKL